MKVTWFGHSAFRLEFADKVVLLDPVLTGNPAFGGDPVKASEGATHILLTHVLLTHGHGDHAGDTVAIAERTGATVVANDEICLWLGSRGVAKSTPPNTGGTIDLGGFTVTFTRADPSSTVIEGEASTPLGTPHGLVVKAEGEPVVYAMGDTAAFADMAIIQDLHRPDILLVPIGDRFTMGATDAADAVTRYFRPRAVIPCHGGSFPTIDATAATFVAALEGSGVQVITPHVSMPVRFGPRA